MPVSFRQFLTCLLFCLSDRNTERMNIYSDRIKQLQKLMADEGIDLYYIPMDDCHMSEYVAAHFKCIEFMSGFTGSAAKLLVSRDKAYLFTDGRYYIQAENELSGSGAELMKEGMPLVPSAEDFAAELIQNGQTLGFDGNVVSAAFAQSLMDKAKKEVRIKYDKDLVGGIWHERPAQEFTDIWEFKEEFAGESTASKIARIRKELKGKSDIPGEYLYIISSLDDIAWIFNIRADDIPCNPVAYAYAAMTEDEVFLCASGKINDGLLEKLRSENVTICPYGPSYICREIKKCTTVFMDKARISFSIYNFYKERGAKIKDIKDPSTMMKALKNDTEIKNTKEVYIRDGIAVIKLMKWIKALAAETERGKAIKEGGVCVTELDIDAKLQELRSENKDYLGPSFDTIAAYGANGAMMHYEAVPGKCSVLKAKGMLLVDSGGQYRGATTDITRTFVLGELSDDEKKSYTLTAVSMLRLMNVKFIKGCTGENIDMAAREPMWENGLDYKCGTGHGVGCCLNVHEGPHRIRWKITDGKKAPLSEGMFVTDEPGVYKEGLYGIRIENELIVRPYMETADGTFLQFENMTFIPIDPDGIDEKYMTQEDVKLYRSYQQTVCEKSLPLLDEETGLWLKQVCEG